MRGVAYLRHVVWNWIMAQSRSLSLYFSNNVPFRSCFFNQKYGENEKNHFPFSSYECKSDCNEKYGENAKKNFEISSYECKSELCKKSRENATLIVQISRSEDKSDCNENSRENERLVRALLVLRCTEDQLHRERKKDWILT